MKLLPSTLAIKYKYRDPILIPGGKSTHIIVAPGYSTFYFYLPRHRPPLDLRHTAMALIDRGLGLGQQTLRSWPHSQPSIVKQEEGSDKTGL